MTAARWDVVVLGGGAAGLMAAMEAGRRGRRVLLVEHGERVGRKILISGGGRCNFTNVNATAANLLSENPHFAKSAMARYRPAEFIAMVERHGIRYHEKTLGQLFCDDSAAQIVRMLERECGEAGVEVRCGVGIVGVRKTRVPESGPGAPGRWLVETSVGELECESVVVATGGLSIPKMGATGFGYEVARGFGHAVVEPRAALVPLVFGAEDRERWCDLSGLSAEVVARVGHRAASGEKQVPRFARNHKSKKERDDKFGGGGGVSFREKMLVTHRGLSGPAVLQISSYWRPGGEVSFDLAPGLDVLAAMLEKNARRDQAAMFGLLRGILPARMAERWVALVDGDWTNAGIERKERALHAWTLRPAGSEGFAKAEVTAGGVDTRELDARTMESQRVAGLYFIGEVVDVTGWLGGYNFQWAWASGAAAGREA